MLNNHGKVSDVLEMVARIQGVLVEEVIDEISVCIDMALESVNREEDQQAKALWDSIPSQGAKPTPEELLSFIVNKIQEDSCESSCVNV